MRLPSFDLAASAVLAAALALVDASRPPLASGIVAFVSDRDDVLVRVDGRFVGDTGPAGSELVLRLPAGTRRVRLSAPGANDLAADVVVVAGRRRVFAARLPAPDQSAEVGSEPIVAPLGATFRLLLEGGDAGSASRAIATRPTAPRERRLAVVADAGTEAMILVGARTGPVEILLRDVGGPWRPLTPTPEAAGLDGFEAYPFVSPAGAAEIAVRAAAPEGAPVRVLVRCVKAPPPLLREGPQAGIRRRPAPR